MRRRDWHLARRELLKGLGVGAACLPLLQANRASAAVSDRRLVCVLQTGGYREPSWRPPEGPLAAQPLPPAVTPLEPHKDKVVFLPQLTNPHHTGTLEGAYTTIFYGLPGRTGGPYPEPLGKTVDQVVASSLPGGRGRTLALHVQIDLPPVEPARGATRCFWAGADQPVRPEGNPLATYQRLFAGTAQGTSDPAVARLLAERRSMLDVVGRSLQRFGARLGTADRPAIEAHLEAVRGLELQLSAVATAPPGCATFMPPSLAAAELTSSAAYPKILDAQLRLAVAALSCGIAQVVTLQLSSSTGAGLDFGQIVPGIPASGTGYRTPFRNWADLAANPVLGGVDHKRIVDQWMMEKLARLITLLEEVPVLAGTLLGQTAVLWANHMFDGNAAQPQKVPWLLAGSCGGYFRTGQCLPTAGRPIAMVLADLCAAMGVPGAPFGPILPGLRA